MIALYIGLPKGTGKGLIPPVISWVCWQPKSAVTICVFAGSEGSLDLSLVVNTPVEELPLLIAYAASLMPLLAQEGSPGFLQVLHRHV